MIESFYELEERMEILEREPCEGCISRQAVLDKIKEVCFSKEWLEFRCRNGSNGQRDFIINYIEQLPSITPQSKTGYWTDVSYIFGEYKCSECGSLEAKRSDYCPNCGAKMIKPQENAKSEEKK